MVKADWPLLGRRTPFRLFVQGRLLGYKPFPRRIRCVFGGEIWHICIYAPALGIVAVNGATRSQMVVNDKIEKTDPARELVELCDAVFATDEKQMLGEVHLAKRFGVKPWSREFYQIIFTISERVELLASIINGLELDDDYRAEIVGHVRDILGAFSGPALRNHWEADGQRRVGAGNLQPLKAVTGLVRAKVDYKKLSSEEIAQVIAEVDELYSWLTEHQLSDQDFIRQALLDGLQQFRFRLDKLKWLGWGYTLDSLREIISAYMLLERTGVNAADNPDAEAVLKKTGALIKGVYEKVQVAKGVSETGDFLLRAYGLGALWYQHGQHVVAGLLGSS